MQYQIGNITVQVVKLKDSHVHKVVIEFPNCGYAIESLVLPGRLENMGRFFETSPTDELKLSYLNHFIFNHTANIVKVEDGVRR